MLYPDDFIEKQFLFLSPIEGEKLSFKNDNVMVLDHDGKVKHQSTCYRLLAIFIIGHLSLTTGLIERAKKFGFAIVLMTSTFRLYQVISSTAEANVKLRKRQYQYQGLECAKILIANKIANQRSLLASIRKKSPQQQQAKCLIDEYSASLHQAETLRQLMGVEGNAARVYFKAFFDNVDWKGRTPRIKPDMVNAALDIGYTLLFNFVDVLLAIFGFDRYCGFCHTQFYMRKSLTCDVVEPFRCIIDKQVKKSINLGQITEEDFEVKDGKWLLKRDSNKEYVKIFVSAILKHKKQIYLYVRELYRAFMKGNYDQKFPVWFWEEL